MDELFVAVVVLLLLGMVVMMFKYAKYIHNLPKTENKGDAPAPPKPDSLDEEDKGP